jgi:hypothetical protein
MNAPCRSLNAPQFSAELLPLRRKFAKPGNLLITKGNISGFSLSKPENLLKTNQLLKAKFRQKQTW